MEAYETLRQIADAYDFAARAHDGQARKGAAGEPYVNHVAGVAARLARSPQVDLDTAVAAVLHDVVEDTDRSIEEIEARFGASVAGYVREVTDDKSLPKEERKRLQVVKASDGAKCIKLADKASNLTVVVEPPPHEVGRSASPGLPDLGAGGGGRPSRRRSHAGSCLRRDRGAGRDGSRSVRHSLPLRKGETC